MGKNFKFSDSGLYLICLDNNINGCVNTDFTIGELYRVINIGFFDGNVIVSVFDDNGPLENIAMDIIMSKVDIRNEAIEEILK